jgi:hypothetical protein
MGRVHSMHGRELKYTEFRVGKLKVHNQMGRPRWVYNIKLDFSKQDERVCSGFICLRIEIWSGLLRNTVINLWVP